MGSEPYPLSAVVPEQLGPIPHICGKDKKTERHTARAHRMSIINTLAERQGRSGSIPGTELTARPFSKRRVTYAPITTLSGPAPSIRDTACETKLVAPS